MKTSERHHLKDNELALAVNSAQSWYNENQKTVLGTLGAIIIVGGVVLGYTMWQSSVDARAAGLLAEAMVVEEGRVQPPAPPAGTTNDPTNPGGQLPGTYPSRQAKLEAQLQKFMAAADAYPSSQHGQIARLHAAETLSELGRRDEAIKQYDQLATSGSQMFARAARLGKTSVQIQAGQYDAAIASLKEMSEQKDGSLPSEALLMELARAYKLAGKSEEARKTLNQVVEQHADSPFATEAKAELAKIKS
jgi:predicted negative regulator of RcsB-dependent stress response